MKIPLVDLEAQYLSIKKEIDSAINSVLEDAQFIMGKQVESFEKKFALYCNSKYAIGVSSGSAALFLAIKAAGIKPRDEIITVPNTFISVIEAISNAGASIKFVDVDNQSYTMDPSKIKGAVTEKTKAIIPVHTYGHPADMDPITDIAQEYNLTIIEDCSQAHGSKYKNKKVPISKIGCFSFYPTKNLGAYGDAGAVVTDDHEIAEKICMLRDHGRQKGQKYIHVRLGFNERMDALQAAILKVKLKYLDDWISKRRKNVKQYNEFLKDIAEVKIPIEKEYAKHVYHLYVIRHSKRDLLLKHLKEININCGVHYPIPLHLQSAYKYLKINEAKYPIAEQLSKTVLSLPMFPELTRSQVIFIKDEIKKFQNKNVI